jgi:hypothetical protein
MRVFENCSSFTGRLANDKFALDEFPPGEPGIVKNQCAVPLISGDKLNRLAGKRLRDIASAGARIWVNTVFEAPGDAWEYNGRLSLEQSPQDIEV